MFNVCSKYMNNCSKLMDYGNNPFVVNIDNFSQNNQNFRTALWTGNHLQLTLMSIPVGGDIGLEMHEDVDQFLRIENGCALVMMGECRDNMTYRQKIDNHYAIIVPAKTWHNIINIGNCPLKLYSVYAPYNHPFGTIHTTKAEAQMYE